MFGTKIASKLIYLKTEHIEGWLLKNIESGSGKENSFIKKNIRFAFLNERPIELPSQLDEICDSHYKKYNKNAKYISILHLKLSSSDCDFNLSPNKREVLISLATLKTLTEEL